jgi:hypothetical protein
MDGEEMQLLLEISFFSVAFQRQLQLRTFIQETIRKNMF